jgi:hypothetical protein
MARSRGFPWILAALCLSLAQAASAADTAKPDATRSVNIVGGPAAGANAPAAPHYENAAGLAIEILPAHEVEIGGKVLFKVSSKKPGYLILVDVDAGGKVTQIYPNLYSMAIPLGATMTIPKGATESSNLLKPGRTIVIPDANDPLARFEYVAEPPSGQGIIIALLSSKPVHMADLPDVPSNLAGSPGAIDFLYQAARDLRLAPEGTQLADPQWSFEAKFYAITR